MCIKEILFDEFKRISIDKNSNVTSRGHPKILDYSYFGVEKPVKKYSVTCLPVHSLTHFDIPKNISLNIVNKFFKPDFFTKVAIINLCYKKDFLNKFLLRESDILFGDIIYPFLDIVKLKNISDEGLYTAMLKILNRIEIDENDVLQIFELSGLRDFDGIIFRTDWSDFKQGNQELNNPFFEMFHAFLIHPYINLKTLKFIKVKNPNIKFLGFDIPDLTNPMCFVDINNTVPFIRNFILKYRKGRDFFKDIDLIETFVDKNSRYFIKNVGRLDSVQKKNELITIGSMILVPIPLLCDPRGIVCELYFRNNSR